MTNTFGFRVFPRNESGDLPGVTVKGFRSKSMAGKFQSELERYLIDASEQGIIEGFEMTSPARVETEPESLVPELTMDDVQIVLDGVIAGV